MSRLHWMPWLTLKEFDRYQQMESHFGRAKFRKRMRELNARADRKLAANALAIFPELEGRP
jgi:hypothetical protein